MTLTCGWQILFRYFFTPTRAPYFSPQKRLLSLLFFGNSSCGKWWQEERDEIYFLFWLLATASIFFPYEPAFESKIHIEKSSFIHRWIFSQPWEDLLSFPQSSFFFWDRACLTFPPNFGKGRKGKKRPIVRTRSFLVSVLKIDSKNKGLDERIKMV